MQKDLDAYLVQYNEKRPHQGRNMNGLTPLQAFKKGVPTKPRAKEAAMQKIAATLIPEQGQCQVITVTVQNTHTRQEIPL